jgi:hypothetical protein
MIELWLRMVFVCWYYKVAYTSILLDEHLRAAPCVNIVVDHNVVAADDERQ